MRYSLFALVLFSSSAMGYAPPREVQTILDQQCVKCHGPLEERAGLRLDTAEHLAAGSDDGPVVVLGEPNKSKLLHVLAAGATPHMPPKKQLSDADIATITNWIKAPHEKAAKANTSGPVPTDPSAAIDFFLSTEWNARSITAAPLCDDRTFLRRVTLDLAGRIPTPDEAAKFMADTSAEKRVKLVDTLIASDEAARTFREVWDVLLMGRQPRREAQRQSSGWHAYLESAWKKNRPWDEIVRGFLVARPSQPEDKGAIWFLYERKNDFQQIAEAVAPIVYGTRIDCAQCHDHPLAAEIKQAHYWGLVAAFNRSKNTDNGPMAVKESATGGVMNFTNLKKESQPAVISLFTGQVITEPKIDQNDPKHYSDAKAGIPKFSRRLAVAEAVTRNNPLLAKSFVNHTWALLMGRGLVDPTDEINSKHVPSHPELFEWLSKDFVTNGYRVKRLVRSIVLSRGYQLTTVRGQAPPADAFAASIERPLTGETIARSLRVAAGLLNDDAALRMDIVTRFPDVLPKGPRATVQQAMFLTNSDAVAKLFDNVRLSGLPDEQVRQIFQRVLTRPPDSEELARGIEFLQSHPKGGRDLLWALATGPEFLTNH